MSQGTVVLMGRAVFAFTQPLGRDLKMLALFCKQEKRGIMRKQCLKKSDIDKMSKILERLESNIKIMNKLLIEDYDKIVYSIKTKLRKY